MGSERAVTAFSVSGRLKPRLGGLAATKPAYAGWSQWQFDQQVALGRSAFLACDGAWTPLQDLRLGT